MSSIAERLRKFISPKSRIFFYPSCGNYRIEPELFKLDYDLFLFCDYVSFHKNGNQRCCGRISNKKIDKARGTFTHLQEFYEKPNLDDREHFWEGFISKFTAPDAPKMDSGSFKVLEKNDDFVVFCYLGKQGVLLFWDNNLSLAYLRDHLIPISCFVGINDGCSEDGNYECVNSIGWIERVVQLAPPGGLLYITDHREGEYGSEHAGRRDELRIEDYTVQRISQAEWMQQKKLERNPLQPFFHVKDDLEIHLITRP